LQQIEGSPSPEGSGADYGNVRLGFHGGQENTSPLSDVILTEAAVQAQGRISRGSFNPSRSTRDPSPRW
ncbi:MAG: hypothetical protein WCB05_17430, partial [Candidatus Sulfotelmatobacter sp.]